jgi:hypothetical protein
VITNWSVDHHASQHCRALEAITLPLKPNKEFLVHSAGKTNLPELKKGVTIDSDTLLEFC